MNPNSALSGSTPATFQRGFTMVELMVGLTLGMIVLAIVTTVFVNISNNRHDTERVGRQIENGRYAVQLLADDLVNAGYFGEFDPSQVGVPAVKPDPCSINLNDMKAHVMMHVQGYRPAAVNSLSCISDVKPDTSVIAVRRLATCTPADTPAATNCDPFAEGEIHLQSSLCNTELAAEAVAARYIVAATKGAFTLHKRNCTTLADIRKYEMHIYFVANNNNNNPADGIPTLKRAELSLSDPNNPFRIVPLVEGIENLQVEYGLDDTAPFNSMPDMYTADPGKGCATDECYVKKWTNVVTARVHVLSRTTESTVGQKDVKTFSLGMGENDKVITVGPFNDKYKRHVYSQTVRMNNPAGRRE